MRFKLGSTWRKGTPIVNVSGRWKPVIGRWIKVNGLWKRTFTPAPNYNAIVNMDAESNQWWDLFYAFRSDLVDPATAMGNATTKQTVEDLKIVTIALTVKMAGQSVSSHRRAELLLQGDHLSKNIPVIYFDGIPAFHDRTALSDGNTLKFYVSEQDIIPKPDMEVSF